MLWSELLRTDPEREVAFRGEARYVQRLARGRSVSTSKLLDPAVPLRLESRERGHLDTLRFAPFSAATLRTGRGADRRESRGHEFPRRAQGARALSRRSAGCAHLRRRSGGIVKAVGASVTHVAPGDRVFGLAVFGLATQTLARAGDVRRIPGNLSFEEAATLPVVFMTSWHALKNVARLRAGERILVHAGAGGVGMAAIQIAHHLGAEVIATAGSATKRALLKTLGVKHVIDSRRGDFAEAVMELTGRRGVDVVLNALAGEAIPMGLSCLAEFGRFIEIGKRDIYQNSRIPLWPLRRNASFHVVAMDAVFSGDEALTREMLGEACRTGRRRRAHAAAVPLLSGEPHRCGVPSHGERQTYRQSRRVVSRKRFVPRRGEPLAAAVRDQAGRLLPDHRRVRRLRQGARRWLVKCGARHLVLTSRSGAATPEAEAFVPEPARRAAWTCGSCERMSVRPRMSRDCSRKSARAINRCAASFISRW